MILLNRHAAAGTGTGLTAREINGDHRFGERQVRHHAFKNRGQSGPCDSPDVKYRNAIKTLLEKGPHSVTGAGYDSMLILGFSQTGRLCYFSSHKVILRPVDLGVCFLDV